MLTDTRNAKAWPKVFADGVGLPEAFASVVEQIDDRGLFGGTHRRRYAEFLRKASRIVDVDLAVPARAYESAADRWLDVAAVCRTIPAVDAAAEASARRREAVARGDAGERVARAVAEEVAKALEAAEPLSPEDAAGLFSDLAAGVRAAVEAERSALEELRSSLG